LNWLVHATQYNLSISHTIAKEKLHFYSISCSTQVSLHRRHTIVFAATETSTSRRLHGAEIRNSRVDAPAGPRPFLQRLRLKWVCADTLPLLVDLLMSWGRGGHNRKDMPRTVVLPDDEEEEVHQRGVGAA
jgi:hypothetical protein